MQVSINIKSTNLVLDLDTDESYSLAVETPKDGATVNADIQAETFFGARHALETLSQLVTYDPTKRKLQVSK